MAELSRINVSEALATRDYPLVLRERRLLLPERVLNFILGAGVALVAVVYALATFWFEATRLQRHAIEIASIIFGAVGMIVLKEMRREHILEVSADGLRLRPHSASAPMDIAWRDILSIAEESGEVILTRRAELPYRQALLREVFGFNDLDQAHFGTNSSELARLLETHRAANRPLEP